MIRFKIDIIRVFSICVLLSFFSITQAQSRTKGFASWAPAKTWEDALLTGNGTLGAMVIGDPFEEQVIVNHALLYLPSETPLVPPKMSDHLDEIRQLSFDGKWEEAVRLGKKIWQDAGYGEKKWTDPYVPALDLRCSMKPANVHKYQRSVNYETAEATVTWTDDNGTFTRKMFASRDNKFVVMQITGSSKVSTELWLRQHPYSWEQSQKIKELVPIIKADAEEDGWLTYRSKYGNPHDKTPEGYEGMTKVIAPGGIVSKEGSKLKIENADEVLLILAVEPLANFNISVIDSLKNVINNGALTYDALLANHVAIHGEMYNRVALNLYPTEEEQNMLSETLSLGVRKGTTPGLIQRQYEAARYNIICSTGTNPPNLQGIWSGTWTPPWCSDFTHDGNVQVAISNLLNGNLPELMLAYFDYHERLLDDYRTNAKQFYNARGFHIASHTSTHGLNNHYDETWCMEYWNGGAGWTAFYFYDYFLYTIDEVFLRERAYPFMKEALAFWEDMLINGDDGKYIVVPSYSPENNPLEHRWQNCINATMDVMIIKELMRNCIAAASVLNTDKEKIKLWRNMLSDMPAYQIAEDGVLREWLWPGLTDNQAHRHASHLYGLYEIPDPEIVESEELQKAALKTIHERMKIRKQHNGGEMAFGMCHLAFSAINLGDTETAEEIVNWLSRYYWTKGMATTHNPGNLFNMDISGGFPAAITRMLVTSYPGEIQLLPALPETWEKGDIKGIALRGAITMDELRWQNNSVEAMITAKYSSKVKVKVPEAYQASTALVNGKKVKIIGGYLNIVLPKDIQVTISLNKN